MVLTTSGSGYSFFSLLNKSLLSSLRLDDRLRLRLAVGECDSLLYVGSRCIFAVALWPFVLLCPRLLLLLAPLGHPPPYRLLLERT